MYVCVCRAITDHQIRQAIDDGACSVRDLSQRLGIAVTCGKCGRYAKQLLKEASVPCDTTCCQQDNAAAC